MMRDLFHVEGYPSDPAFTCLTQDRIERFADFRIAGIHEDKC